MRPNHCRARLSLIWMEQANLGGLDIPQIIYTIRMNFDHCSSHRVILQTLTIGYALFHFGFSTGRRGKEVLDCPIVIAYWNAQSGREKATSFWDPASYSKGHRQRQVDHRILLPRIVSSRLHLDKCNIQATSLEKANVPSLIISSHDPCLETLLLTHYVHTSSYLCQYRHIPPAALIWHTTIEADCTSDKGARLRQP
jgi:hypothetical protein